jgi:hypothetical protein
VGTGSRRTTQKQYSDDESPRHARTRTRSVNATVPSRAPQPQSMSRRRGPNARASPRSNGFALHRSESNLVRLSKWPGPGSSRRTIPLQNHLAPKTTSGGSGSATSNLRCRSGPTPISRRPWAKTSNWRNWLRRRMPKSLCTTLEAGLPQPRSCPSY